MHYAKGNMSDKDNITVQYHLNVASKKYNKLVNITTKKQTRIYREQSSGG